MKNIMKGLAHIGVPCADLGKTIKFYEGLGFESAAKAENLNGYRVAMLENNGCILELYESMDKAEKNAVEQRVDGHVDHIALCVEDIDKAFAYCSAEGYPVVTDGIESTNIWNPKKCRYFTVLGVNGERVEFSRIEE